jgi:hypothetical protein
MQTFGCGWFVYFLCYEWVMVCLGNGCPKNRCYTNGRQLGIAPATLDLEDAVIPLRRLDGEHLVPQELGLDPHPPVQLRRPIGETQRLP